MDSYLVELSSRCCGKTYRIWIFHASLQCFLCAVACKQTGTRVEQSTHHRWPVDGLWCVWVSQTVVHQARVHVWGAQQTHLQVQRSPLK